MNHKAGQGSLGGYRSLTDTGRISVWGSRQDWAIGPWGRFGDLCLGIGLLVGDFELQPALKLSGLKGGFGFRGLGFLRIWID